MADAPAPARAVILADKLHNLASIVRDLREGRPIWGRFNAGRSDVLWYYRASIDVLSRGEADDPRLARLANDCRQALAEVESFGEPLEHGR